MTHDACHEWVAGFGLDSFLLDEVARVVHSLPPAVRDDLVGDPAFTLYDYEPGPDVVMRVPVRAPGRNGAGRCVVLKRTLRHRPADFVRWLIAHELAHAHLRHGGRFPGEDPESAADALAAEWGYPRPR